MSHAILASDFHLSPARPREIEVFVQFCHEVARGADQLFILGDLFNFWIGPGNLAVAGLEPALDALAALGEQGVAVTLLHGNRDFLMGAAEARRTGSSVPGEEVDVRLFGRRYLLL
ncbi:MAG: UDP-2,3-diacylglucosamine diphosphatase, partial [bacterium]|nr:UDP-2,3-diacylglucosamine diphosphatase [bacterium]